MPSIISNSDTEDCLREILEAEGYQLTPNRGYGETGVDIIAKKNNGEFYIEVIGYKSSGPARAKDFYEAFFRAVSRLNDGARRCVIAMPYLAKRGLPARARQYGVAWNRISDAFPELQIWLVNTETKTYERTAWKQWSPNKQTECDRGGIPLFADAPADGTQDRLSDKSKPRENSWTKKIVYIDMDNVLVDFPSAFPKLDEDTLRSFDDNRDEIPEIFSLMEPVPGAIEAFQELSILFDTYILSTSPWENPSAWSDKLEWVKRYLGERAERRLILTHHKNLNTGHYLVDDRRARGADRFEGELLLFRSSEFPDWESVLSYLRAESGSGHRRQKPLAASAGPTRTERKNRSSYDYNRPFVLKDSLEIYEASDGRIARKYGRRVKAMELSNREYKYRFERFHKKQRMKPPPSSERIFPGFLVVRKLDMPEEYETWMPDHVFDEMYKKRE